MVTPDNPGLGVKETIYTESVSHINQSLIKQSYQVLVTPDSPGLGVREQYTPNLCQTLNKALWSSLLLQTILVGYASNRSCNLVNT